MVAESSAAYCPRHMPVRNSKLLQRVRSWPRRAVVTIGVIIVLLLGARIAMPYVVKQIVTDRLHRIPGYTGYVNDIGIHLWRGAYSLHGFGILRLNGKVREPFFLAKDIDFSLAWHELWHRKIVSEVRIEQGQLNFVKGRSAEESQTDLDRRWQEVIKDIFPIDITQLEITDGLLRYVDMNGNSRSDGGNGRRGRIHAAAARVMTEATGRRGERVSVGP